MKRSAYQPFLRTAQSASRRRNLGLGSLAACVLGADVVLPGRDFGPAGSMLIAISRSAGPSREPAPRCAIQPSTPLGIAVLT